jgi:ABC-type antimicrobial peptide transport system permease subunit
MPWLQPLKDVVLGKDLSNSIGLTMEHTMVWIIGALAFIVMLSACFNYTNLSIARAFRRSREVGIRKVIGALRGHVLAQFLAEAVMIALLALVLSLGFFFILRPFFLSISPNLSRLVSLDLSWPLVLSFVVLAILVGLIAGLLPAVFFSRINAIQVLRNLTSFKVFRHVTVRKALITVQYTLSLAFIAATFIGYKQYRYFLTIDLGFNTANILNIDLEGNKPDAFVNALKELPEVNGVSGSQMVTSVGNYWSTGMKYLDPTDSITVYYNAVNEHYLPLHGHKLLAGRNFTPTAPDAVESEVIVNQQVLKHFNIGQNDPQKALGEFVTVNLRKMQIIGVVKDFHYGKVDSQIEPVVFRYMAKPEGFVNVSITATDLPETMKRIEAAWKTVDRIHPINAHFYDEQIERAYSEFSAMLKILGFLAILAVSIASMGLLGMVVFTTETRLREVSIRKVLGASMAQLMFLLSRGFLLLLGIAALIALPATYFFFDQVVLTLFAYHAPLGIGELALSFGLVLLIALFMTSSQMVKVARSNPAEVLKGE